jgi:sugar phosphate isomerase/epimerase
MRLGGTGDAVRAADADELVALVPKLDAYGLSALAAPRRLAQMTDDDAVAFGVLARSLGLVVGEVAYLGNLMTDDAHARAERIGDLRTLLRKSDLAGCGGVVLLVGTKDPSDRLGAPHPYMFTPECEDEFASVLDAVLDGIELSTSRIFVEPWPTTFFYRPERIERFLTRLGDPRVVLHLDLANMIDPQGYFETTALIDEVFDRLSPSVGSVHLKDVRWDPEFMLLKLDEVLVGDGMVDYPSFLGRLSTLDEDLTCFCEHLASEAEYAANFERLHALAAELGLAFSPRKVPVA